MFRVQASERSARAQVKTLSTELKKQKAKVSELISEATERAKRFDQDMKKSAHTERKESRSYVLPPSPYRKLLWQCLRHSWLEMLGFIKA